MRIGKRLFPYPVINNQKDLSSFEKSNFGFEFNIIQNKGEFILDKIRYSTDNENLERLIESKKANVVCIIECSSSIYRKTFDITNEFTRITIPIQQLKDKVVISAYVYATENITDYHDFDFQEDYQDYSFHIDKYDILALDDGFTTRVNYDENEDNKVSSIFLIIKDEANTSELMKVEETVDKIVIQLPPTQYDIYFQMRVNSFFNQIFFSIFIIPALSYIISKNQNSDVEELRTNYSWFSAIEKKYMELYQKELDNASFEKISPVLFAQELMNFPTTKSINDLFTLTMQVPEEDYDE